ncbi:hypothetical protein M0R04_12455 [Candidatus Dojkabacteria bacterium]|jgi:rubrerythrin|nr:hypothetical protein [Candidatus Dojkabacteria bacterium]
MFQVKPIAPELWEKILQESREGKPFKVADKYAKEVNMNKVYLYQKIRKTLEKEEGRFDGGNGNENLGEEKRNNFIETAKDKANARKEAYDGIKLTTKEKKLIQDIADGKVDLESASRVIASKAFEKLLKFPDSASFTNFIQSELLKLKRQELTDKNTWAMELVNRMFNGVLPPRVCPKCGEVLVKLPVLEGEIIEDESV